VFCGPGNNGGDGLVLARLAREAGWQVRVGVLAGRGTPESNRAADEWRRSGGQTESIDAGLLAEAELVIDALFGIGLTRAPEAEAAAAITAVNAAAVPVLALDVPSGLDADRGCAPGMAVRATHTISFIAHKCGLHTGRARAQCGPIELATLELNPATRCPPRPASMLLDAAQLAHWLPRRARDAHKGHHGHVLAIGGDHGLCGAIRLCAEAALRCGAGYVAVATRSEHVAALVGARPEALVSAVEDGGALQAALARSSVVAIGPGLGQGAWGRELFQVALQAGQPLVLDADALNLLAQAPRKLPDAILTPQTL
jgi:NAD(P)H-hydrate epimerase